MKKIKIRAKAVEGWEEHFMVTDTGLVVRKKGTFNYRGDEFKRPAKLMKSYMENDCPVVCLNAQDCDPEIVRVHRAVAKAFLPNPKKATQVRHKDGNKHNNHVNNLEWIVRKSK